MNGAGYAEFDAAKLRRSNSKRPTSLALKGVKVGQGGNAGEVKSLSIAVEVLRLSSKMELSAVSRLSDENRIESFFERRNRFGGYADGGGGTGCSGMAPAVCVVMLPPRTRVKGSSNPS